MDNLSLAVLAERIRRILFLLFLAQWVLVWIRLWLPLPALEQARWPEGLLVVLATATTLAALTRQLPAQNVMLVPILIAVLAGGAHCLGVLTSVPFGPYLYTERVGQFLFYPLPWAVPMIWIVFLLTSRGVARMMLEPWRRIRNYGFWVLGVTSLLVVMLDGGLEPWAARVNHCWLWTSTKTGYTWYGAPWVNFIGWGTVAALILAFATPWLINKRPTPPPREWHSLLVWLLLNALFLTNAIVHRFWPVVLLCGLACSVVAAMAWYGSSRRTDPGQPRR